MQRGLSRSRRLLGAALATGVAASLIVLSSNVSARASTAARSTISHSGCGESASAGSSTASYPIGGRNRTVIVHLPSNDSNKRPLPLVLNLHGTGSTASEQELFSGMDKTADADDFIVAYPQAIITSGSGFDWNVPGQALFGGSSVPKGTPDDVQFLVQLVSTLEQRYCIDAHRVYATGFSGGGRMASQLGCDASRVFAAIAPVSGLRLPTPCPAGRAVPVLSFHGTADPVDPYLGHGQAYWTYSVPVAASRWAVHDGCSTKVTTTRPAPTVSLTIYAPCSGRARVELYSITGEGHEWPGGPHLPRYLTSVLGPQSNAIDADTTIWSFFSSYSS